MHKEGFYSAGEFMKLAHITKKTIRYYDEHNVLKPSFVDPDSHARFYTEADLAKLQQILLLKFLGFSLADIKIMTVTHTDTRLIEESLHLQKKLVEERIDQLSLVAETITATAEQLHSNQNVDWSQSLALLNQLGIEKSLKSQYNNSSNISARINLHALYSSNKQGWFPWIYEQSSLRPGMNVLELGCGDGSFWSENMTRLPKDIRIVLSDLSDGMLHDAKRTIGSPDTRFSYQAFDCLTIPFKNESFDLIIANHLLFYCEDIPAVIKEVARVLKKSGVFLCSTYSSDHMKEIRELVSLFDDRIVLSGNKLYEKFGKENGSPMLHTSFSSVTWHAYEDNLLIPSADALISYILSCHGNQNQYIIDRYSDFKQLVQKHTERGFRVTKDAGIFIAKK